MHGDGVIYHVSGYKNDEAYVYRIIDNYVERQNIDTESESILNGAIWNGQSEAIRKLIKNEPVMAIDWDFMQLRDGIDFAEFMVDITIKYQRFSSGLASCGGDIDILVITKDYSKWIKHKVLKP